MQRRRFTDIIGDGLHPEWNYHQAKIAREFVAVIVRTTLGWPSGGDQNFANLIAWGLGQMSSEYVLCVYRPKPGMEAQLKKTCKGICSCWSKKICSRRQFMW